MGDYGMPIFGLLVPWPPPYVLWALMALDIALTFMPAIRRRRRTMVLLILLSAYLAYAGLWSVGILFVLLGVVQLALLVQPKSPARRSGP